MPSSPYPTSESSSGQGSPQREANVQRKWCPSREPVLAHWVKYERKCGKQPNLTDFCAMAVTLADEYEELYDLAHLGMNLSKGTQQCSYLCIKMATKKVPVSGLSNKLDEAAGSTDEDVVCRTLEEMREKQHNSAPEEGAKKPAK